MNSIWILRVLLLWREPARGTFEGEKKLRNCENRSGGELNSNYDLRGMRIVDYFNVQGKAQLQYTLAHNLSLSLSLSLWMVDRNQFYDEFLWLFIFTYLIASQLSISAYTWIYVIYMILAYILWIRYDFYLARSRYVSMSDKFAI